MLVTPFAMGIVATAISRIVVAAVTGTLAATAPASSVTTYVASATSIAAALPNGLTAGDIVVACLAHRSPVATPDGWSLIKSISYDTTPTSNVMQYLSTFRKDTVASGDSGAAATFVQSAAGRIGLFFFSVRASAGIPVLLDAVAATSLNVLSASIAPPAPVATMAEQHFCVAVSELITTTTTSLVQTPPAGMTLLSPPATADNRMGVAYKAVANASALSGTFIIDSGQAANNAMGAVTMRFGAIGAAAADPSLSSVKTLLYFAGANASTTITDSAPSPKAFAAVGAASVSTAVAKFGGAALVLDGAGSYVETTASLADFAFGSGDFTAECWVRTTDNNFVLLDFYLTASANCWQLMANAAGQLIWNSNSGSASVPVITGSTAINNGAWRHVAACRVAGTLRLFIDGQVEGSAADSRVYGGAATRFAVGAQVSSRSATYDLAGYVDEVRVTKGVGRYAAAFVPAQIEAVSAGSPGATDALFSSVTALLHFDIIGAATTSKDSSLGNRTWTIGGNAIANAAALKFGAGGLKTVSAGDFLSTPDNAAFDMPTGDFTIECWVMLNSLATLQVIFNKAISNGVTPWRLSFDVATLKFRFYGYSSAAALLFDISSTTSPVVSTWYHVAIVRNGTVFQLFVDGQLQATSATVPIATALCTVAGPVTLGSRPDGAQTLNGFIDEFRITKGAARYTSTFSKPTSAFLDA